MQVTSLVSELLPVRLESDMAIRLATARLRNGSSVPSRDAARISAARPGTEVQANPPSWYF